MMMSSTVQPGHPPPPHYEVSVRRGHPHRRIQQQARDQTLADFVDDNVNEKKFENNLVIRIVQSTELSHNDRSFVF